MNLYTVTYKTYSTSKVLQIVAASPAKAIERARPIIRKRDYSDKEILQVVKQHEIDGIAR